MSRDLRSIVYRYGLAALVFTAVIAVSLLLRYLGYQVNLTILIVIALVAVSWWGGRGPGIVFCALVAAATVAMNPLPADQSMTRFLFGIVSVLAILLLIVFLISGRKLTEQKLRDQSDLLSITLSSIGDAVIATDADGRVRFVNRTAEKLTGCPAAEAIGRPLSEIYKIVDEESGKQMANVFESVRDKRAIMTFPGEISLINCEGATVAISDTASPIIDSSGKFRGAVVVFQDVTERRRAEEMLRQSEARSRQSQKLEAIGTLTGGIAHDFNNLLTAILGFAQLSLRSATPYSPAYNNLVLIEKSATRGGELTRKLLAFSRQQHLERRVIDLNESIGEILKLLERVIGENIKVAFMPAKDLEPIYADPAQIEQVIMNLSVNARDAMPRGGRLAVETRNVELDDYYCRQYPGTEPGRYVQLLVSDNGIGIEPDALDKIFEPFFTTKDVNQGTGLGLSMVYGIIKQHGGHISVYSEPGRGTTFKVFLPVVEVDVDRSRPPVQPSLLGGTETVLVAEDEEALRLLSNEVLSALGYRVLVAANGREAVEIFKEYRESIDLLLFDVVMPVMGGSEAYLKIRELGGDKLPLIFMTGYSSEVLDGPTANDPHLAEIGGARFIQKPYTLDMLGRAVRDALDAMK